MSTETAPPPDATPPETPWTEQIFDPASPRSLAEGWLDKVPQDQRQEWERHKDAKSIFDVIENERGRRKEAQTELRNRAAADKGLPLRPEGEAATPEAWKAYREAHGLPETPDGYGITKPKDYPDALWVDQEARDFAKFAHDNDISPAAVKAITEWYQSRGLTAYAAHQQAVAAQQAAEAKARADYIQSQKETLAQNHGVHLDRDLKNIAKMANISGMDAERFNPDNPDQFIGADAVKAFASIYAMLPKSGDPTARMLGRNESQGVKDRSYYTGPDWKAGNPDYDAWAAGPTHARFAEVNRLRNLAYELDSQQREGAR